MQMGIMFDMDNTLLQSRINFSAMREDLIRYLLDSNIGTPAIYEQQLTPAQVIETGKRLLNGEPAQPQVVEHMFEIVTKHETKGMRNVQLEDGVKQGLALLKRRGYILAVVTNNAYAAACLALQKTDILPFLDIVIGRDQMEALKPYPSGLLVVKDRYPEVNRWIMLGDSWIDGKAAQLAGVGFVAYKGDRSRLCEQGVCPVSYVAHFTQFVTWLETWVKKEEPPHDDK